MYMISIYESYKVRMQYIHKATGCTTGFNLRRGQWWDFSLYHRLQRDSGAPAWTRTPKY